MPNIINPNCLSLPQQVEKNKQDILKILASNLEELSGLQFIPNNLIYQNQQAVINGKFVVIRDETSIEIDGVVSIPFVGENGIVVDGSEDNLKIRIALDQSDRELFNYVQELVNRTTESDEIVFTSDMENFVTEATEKMEEVETIYDRTSQDANINWGYTGGITNDITITKDLSKYSKLIIYCQNYPNGGSFIVDLNNPYWNQNTQGQGVVYSCQYDSALYVYLCRVNKNGDNLSFTFVRYRHSDTLQNTYGYVYKIEGVIAK